MKVSELIEALKQMPQDMEVEIESSYGEYPPYEIRSIQAVASYPDSPTNVVISSSEFVPPGSKR